MKTDTEDWAAERAEWIYVPHEPDAEDRGFAWCAAGDVIVAALGFCAGAVLAVVLLILGVHAR
jgi:hypothetical protein